MASEIAKFKRMVAYLFLLIRSANCRIFCFFLLGSYLSTSSGQALNSPFYSYLENKDNFQAGYSYEAASNALTNSFIKTMLFKSFIDDKSKNSVLPYLKSKNYAGAYSEWYSMYSWKGRESVEVKSAYYVMIKNRSQLDAIFTGDFYQLALFGNKDFAGKTAILDGSKFHSISYVDIIAGIDKKILFNRDKYWTFNIGIGLVKGEGHSFIEIPNGSVFTGDEGDSLMIKGKFSVKTANASRPGFGGTGVTSNLHIEVPQGLNNTFRLTISDLGFISWRNKKSRDFSFNGSQSYTGAKVSYINRAFNISNSNFIIDSVFDAYDKSVGSYSTYLPANFLISWEHNFQSQKHTGNKVQFGAEYFAAYERLPKIFGVFTKRLAGSEKRTSLALNGGLNLFGYDGYGVIAALDYKIAEKLFLRFGTSHLESIFSSNMHAQGAFIKGGYFF